MRRSLGAVVEQKDGKDAVVNDGAHQLGGAIEQGLQVEGGIEGVCEVDQIGEVGRFNAGVERVEVGVRVVGVGGAVVAFKLVFRRL